MNSYVKTYRYGDSRKSLPLWAKVIYIITAVTALVHLFAALFDGFADFLNSYISAAVRAVLAFVTNYIPFSLAEALIILIPVIAALLIRYAVKYHSDSWRSVLIYMGSIASVACVFYILFFWSYGVGYHTSTIEEKLDLPRETVSVDELKETADFLAEKANEEARNVRFRKGNFSVMPYGISTLSNKLGDAYETFNKTHKVVSDLDSNLKPVIFSEAMSHTHITGIYSYFTGEANINTAFPDYTIPFTAAHEMAHQRGIAREDEANFVAFLVCIESNDPYIRYCGYVNMLEYVMNALYSADVNLYTDNVKKLDLEIRFELVAYADFFEKYRDSKASEISGAINDTYLKLNGTEGERSYGMVVDLAVAYYKNK
ncbi:MAG: DUF3810 domain-containing protein [Ruminococcaceae bacterium]|nr:DUF3810 domain-containing protein [Oscillospiraceae bacterium]